MTLPFEEKAALWKTRTFLSRILNSNATTVKNEAYKIKEMAASCLRHYPMEYRIDELYELEAKQEPDRQIRMIKYGAKS